MTNHKPIHWLWIDVCAAAYDNFLWALSWIISPSATGFPIQKVSVPFGISCLCPIHLESVSTASTANEIKYLNQIKSGSRGEMN